MLENAIKTIEDIPEEIFKNHLLSDLSEADLLRLSQVSRKNRERVIKRVFKDHEIKRYNKLVDQYLSFWLMNLNFIFSNKAIYKDALLAYSTANLADHSFQKIKTYYLLYSCFYKDSIRQAYCVQILSSLEAPYHTMTTDVIKAMITVQLASETDRLANSFSDQFKEFLFDNSVPFKEKFFLTSIFKYWDNPLTASVLDQLRTDALSHISDHAFEIKKKATAVMGALSSAINFECKSQFINLLIEHSLFDEQVWLRKEAFAALSALAEGFTKHRLVSMVEKKIGALLNDPNIFYKRKAYAAKFLSNMHLELSADQIDALFLYSYKGHYQDNRNDKVWQINLNVLNLISVSLSYEQLLKTVIIFYELLADIATTDKREKLAIQGLAQIAKICPPEKAKRIIENFPRRTDRDDEVRSVAYLQMLSHLSHYLSDDELMHYLKSLFFYLACHHSLISGKASQALAVLTENLSGSQINLIVDSLLEKLNCSDCTVKVVSMNALALLAARIPDECVKKISITLCREIDNQDFSVGRAAVNALRAFVVDKKIALGFDVTEHLFKKINSTPVAINQAAIQALVTSLSFINQEKIAPSIRAILLAQLKHENKKIQLLALEGTAQLSSLMTPEDFIVIHSTLLSNLRSASFKFYRPTLILIEKFKQHIPPLQQKEYVALLIETLVSKNKYCNLFFEQILATLSNFLTSISQAQQVLLQEATTFKMDYALNRQEKKELIKKIACAGKLREKWYTIQFDQFMNENVAREGKYSNLLACNPRIEGFHQKLKALEDRVLFQQQPVEQKKLAQQLAAKRKLQTTQEKPGIKVGTWGFIAAMGAVLVGAIGACFLSISEALSMNSLGLAALAGTLVIGGCYIAYTQRTESRNSMVPAFKTPDKAGMPSNGAEETVKYLNDAAIKKKSEKAGLGNKVSYGEIVSKPSTHHKRKHNTSPQKKSDSSKKHNLLRREF